MLYSDCAKKSVQAGAIVGIEQFISMLYHTQIHSDSQTVQTRSDEFVSRDYSAKLN